MKTKNSKKGFTLIELILVIAIVAVLAGAIFVAIDPARRLNESRNAQREGDVIAMLDAVVKYQVDNDGDHHSEVSAITAGEYVIVGTTDDDDGLCTSEASASAACSNTTTGSGTADCVDLTQLGTNYLADLPNDPSNGSDADTSYYISRASNNTITIGSCDEEGEGAGGAGSAPVIEKSR